MLLLYHQGGPLHQNQGLIMGNDDETILISPYTNITDSYFIFKKLCIHFFELCLWYSVSNCSSVSSGVPHCTFIICMPHIYKWYIFLYSLFCQISNSSYKDLHYLDSMWLFIKKMGLYRLPL